MYKIVNFLTVVLLVSLGTTINAQTASSNTIKGRVVDEKGEVLAGATVVCKGTKTATTTDLNGNYTIQAPSEVKELEISFLGYETATVQANRSVVNVKLLPTQEMLNETVVIGYGTQKKSDLTGSVAVVDMKGIDLTPTVSIDEALQGKIAGVDIMSTSGDPTASSSIRIRGTRSITASNEPLIVVNGIMDAVEDIKDIDPADIKSVSVLKDASATAIYGSRGANGVIIITTKEGQGEKVRLNFTAKFGVSMLANKLDLMNKNEIVQYRNDYNYVEQYIKGKTDIEPKYKPEDFEHDTDWLDEITRLAPYQAYNIAVSGSDKGKKHQYYGSANYTNRQGIIKGSGLQRINLMFTTSRQFLRWLNVKLSITGSYRIENPNKAQIGGTEHGSGAVYLAPVIGPYDDHNPFIDNSSKINTPVACIEYNEFINKKFNNTDAITFTFTPMKGLRIESQNSVIINQNHLYRYWPSYLPKKTEKEGADAQKSENDYLGFSSENTVSYTRKVKKNNFDAMAGFSVQTRQDNALSAKAKALVSDYMKWNNLNAVTSKENYTITSSSSKVVRESAYLRFNYNYDSRYYFTTTMRLDGSSNFAANKKWGFFPSAAVKWNMKNEKFLKNQRWLNTMDVRLSYGRTGNDALSSYSSLQAYTTSTDSYLFDGQQGASFYPVRLASPDLSWEKTDMVNLAIEGSFLKNRIRFTAEVYASRTTDLLLQVKTIQSTGYSTRFENLGNTTNRGVEFTLETSNIETPVFGWTTMLSVSHNSQMVHDIGQEDYVPVISAPSGYMMYGYKSGYPLNSLWGFEYGGTYKNKEEFDRNEITRTYCCQQVYNRDNCLGRPRYVDQDKDGMATMKDLVYLGNADPIVYGGFQNDFYIKNFKISTYLAYSIGGKIYNYAEIYMAGGTQANQFRYMRDCWHPTKNPESDLPRAGHSQTLLPCTLIVHDASFLRIKNITLSYRFDIKKKFMDSITVSLSGENLWLFSNYNGFDPDVSTESENSALRRVDLGSYPKARTVIAGLKINF